MVGMALLLLFILARTTTATRTGAIYIRGDVVVDGGAQLLAKYGVRFNRYVTQSAADDGLK